MYCIEKRSADQLSAVSLEGPVTGKPVFQASSLKSIIIAG